MKSINQWLDEYAVSHQNPTNKMVHFVCVPVIFFTVVGLLYSLRLPVELAPNLYLTVADIVTVLVAIYYFTLSVPLAIGMVLYSALCLVLCETIRRATGGYGNLALVSAGLFVLAWIAQFWGHKVEGKKPSFIKDIQFLMIGPAWIMSFIYKKIGLSI
jgi:uncharacterized membrane protein YGL010W